MEELYDLKEELISQLCMYSTGRRLDRKSVCDIDMLAHATKNLCKIIKDLEESGTGYSRAPHGRMTFKRDHMGRYSTHSPAQMVEELTELMNEAPDEASRQDFQRLINRLNTD